MKGLYERFCVKGEHIEYLLEWLHCKNIAVYDVKTVENGIFLTICRSDSKKLFAISSNMCYNIERIGYKGRYAPLKSALEKIGAVIGAALFLVAVTLTDSVVAKIRYEGDAVYLKREIGEVLNSESVSEWSLISEDKCERLQNAILTSSDKFSFVSVEKKGHQLIIEAYKSYERVVPYGEKKEKIVAICGGTVSRITVLSGTALVSVGDEVIKGDVLIDGSYVHNEHFGTTYALGEVELECEYVYEYSAMGDEELIKSRAITLAKESLGSEATVKDVKTFGGESGTDCKVTLIYYVLMG